VLDTIVFMPPLCVTNQEIEIGMMAIRTATREVLQLVDA
jgi:adenosylmethionine-8-amino-7-oxononanoate aminotransferase